MPASDALDRFRHAACTYCALIDRVKPVQGLEELVRPLHTSVADVYAAALALSPLPVGDEDSQVAARAHEDWKELDDRLRGVLGRADRYYAIWDLECHAQKAWSKEASPTISLTGAGRICSVCLR